MFNIFPVIPNFVEIKKDNVAAPQYFPPCANSPIDPHTGNTTMRI